MIIEPKRIYSFYINLKTALKKLDENVLLNKCIIDVQWNRIKTNYKYIATVARKIHSDIQLKYFSYDDYKLYVLHNFIFDEKYNFGDYKRDDVNKIKNQYSDDKLKLDFNTLKSMSNVLLEIKNVDYYFMINDDGNSHIYNLIINKYISPVVCVKLIDRFVENELKSEKYKKFEFIIKTIKKQKILE
jgi:hypothetical protein